MPEPYTTKEGDMADEIAWKTYGDRTEGLVLLLEANPHLCRLPPMLPAGIRIERPELPAEPPKPAATVRIFT
jgi:phage tail protein X